MVPVDGWLSLRASELAGCARSVRTAGDGRRFESCQNQRRDEPGRIAQIWKNGAGGRIRTADPRITNALLYQLSYTGIDKSAAVAASRVL